MFSYIAFSSHTVDSLKQGLIYSGIEYNTVGIWILISSINDNLYVAKDINRNFLSAVLTFLYSTLWKCNQNLIISRLYPMVGLLKNCLKMHGASGGIRPVHNGSDEPLLKIL